MDWPPGDSSGGRRFVTPTGAPATGRLRADGSLGGTRATQGLTGTGGMRMLTTALLRAFATLDANEARYALDEAFNQYPLETVLTRLVQPVVMRTDELSASGQISHGSARFGYVTLRNRLAALLDAVAMPVSAPLVLLACAPGEFHELGPLMLATLWRRASLRVVYLGADVAEEALIAETRARRPTVLCLSAATEAGARAVARTAETVARFDTPRPLFGYGGAVFVRSPHLQGRIRDAYFLGVDAMVAARHVIQMLQDGPLTPR